jgi:antitoxin VapB
MALHITNPKANRLARRLAKQTGESLTNVITEALEEKLRRDARPKYIDENAKMAELLAIAKRATGLQAEKKTSRELIEELYNEDGLPA